MNSYDLTLNIWDLEGLNALDHSSSLDIKISDLDYHEKIQCLDATSNYRKKKGNYIEVSTPKGITSYEIKSVRFK
mgnify:CR=1 FL=1